MRDISFTLRSLFPLAAVLILASSLALHSAEEVRRAQAVTPAAKPATPPPKAVAVASTNSPVTPTPASANTFSAAKPAEAKPAPVSTSTNTPTGTSGRTVDLTPEQKKKIEEYMARAKTSNEALAKQRKLLDRNMPNADQVNPTITERTSIPSRF